MNALVGLGRLDDGSVGPDGCSEDQGEREGVAREENTLVKRFPTAGLALPTDPIQYGEEQGT